MYRRCKATEDKDMTALDFITDHLLDLDCIFDQHDKGDEQKPHTPIQSRHQQTQNYFFACEVRVTVNPVLNTKKELSIYQENKYVSAYLSSVFRPPIV